MGLCLIVLISLFQVKCRFFMVFTDRSPLLANNFLFYSYIFNINFLYCLAKNIYFAPKCSGQPAEVMKFNPRPGSYCTEFHSASLIILSEGPPP